MVKYLEWIFLSAVIATIYLVCGYCTFQNRWHNDDRRFRPTFVKWLRSPEIWLD